MKKKYIVSSHANYFIILLTLSQSKSIKESNLYIYIYIYGQIEEKSNTVSLTSGILFYAIVIWQSYKIIVASF